MTERPSHAVSREASHFRVGPSALHWDGTALTIDIAEVAVPIPRRLRGRVRVSPSAMTPDVFMLNEHGRHRWWPIAPCARVEVVMQEPSVRWTGDGYLDHNAGDAPIERGFRDWQWARGATRDGAVILYEGERRDGRHVALARHFDSTGASQAFDPPPVKQLRSTGWRMARSVRSESDACIVRTLEDAPFYARSIVAAKLASADVMLMHESLSLDRFRRPVVQAMLPFRMPRARR